MVVWGSFYCYAADPALAGRSPRAVASIVGGAGAAIASFPFQVALYNPAAGSPAAGFFCGGVIVDATHVITAAHCLAGGGHGRGSVSGEIEVLAGSTRLDRPDPGSVRDPAASVSIDPRYDPFTNDYDVGVIALAHPLWSGSSAPRVNGADTIAPLPIDVAAAAGDGEPSSTSAPLATVSGWGDMSAAPSGPPSYPSALRANGVPLVPEALCREEYASIEQTITPRMLCAGSSRPRADSCYGDSGGPLVVDRNSPARPPGDYVLIGLVAFGNGCAQPGFAGVYTRIADPAIARFLASDVGHRAKLAGRRPGRRKKHRRR
ncbi:MAG TPA: serine protease [Solirubrobacteraceae bacterium]|jgi:secreted trypsin-like serine protease|nr:serine protease [Solirubrobacteraceae bacterium]